MPEGAGEHAARKIKGRMSRKIISGCSGEFFLIRDI
jgi:hypothetical protein